MKGKTLEQIQIPEKNRQYMQIQEEVREYYEANEDRIVADMKFDRGLPSAMAGDFEGEILKRNQAEFAKSDPEIQYGGAAVRPFGRVGSDLVDNAANS